MHQRKCCHTHIDTDTQRPCTVQGHGSVEYPRLAKSCRRMWLLIVLSNRTIFKWFSAVRQVKIISILYGKNMIIYSLQWQYVPLIIKYTTIIGYSPIVVNISVRGWERARIWTGGGRPAIFAPLWRHPWLYLTSNDKTSKTDFKLNTINH